MSNYGKMHLYDDLIRKRHAEKIPARQIAKEIGCDLKSILNRAKVLGLDFWKNSKFHKEERGKDRLWELVDYYNSGCSPIEILNIYGYQPELPIPISKKSKYVCNESFFEKIDTQEKAYLLGLWYADGCVTGRKAAIDLKDKELVECIKYLIGYTGPIYSPRDDRHGFALEIHRIKIVRDLINLNCIPRKSLILKFPTPDIVPPYLIRHFVRGWFDGDGCISYSSKYDRYTIPLIGTFEFINGLRNLYNLDGCLYQKNNKNTYIFIIFKKEYMVKFINEIYKDARICLYRKAIRCNDYMNKSHLVNLFT